jgi:hypothetical protein
MKRTLSTLTIAALSLITVPALANNWQSQLDQIKANQQRHAKCHAAEQARLMMEKMAEAKRQADQLSHTAPVK